MPQTTEVFSRKNSENDLAETIGYTVLRSDDALYIHTRDGWKVASRDKANALSNQGWTLCLDNLTQFLGNPETSDDGKEEAARIKSWMLSQK